MYKSFIRPLLFQIDPEKVHHLAFDTLKMSFGLPGSKALSKRFRIKHSKLERELLGLKFPNPVGLAAGFDKNAVLLKPLSQMGFGFVEIGTVTPLPQEGNPKPRLFRLKEDTALINRMGFNNDGLEAVKERLKHRPAGLIVGGNIGKNKVTPNEEAVSDYEKAFEALHDLVDYFVVNVSSPNTPGLRELQDKEPLTRLLNRLRELNADKSKPKPILLKIAPDLNDDQLSDITEIIRDTKLDGIIATNTTISRDDLKTGNERISQIGAGGLSGKPLRERATEVIRYLRQNSSPDLVIIGVGGIHSPEDALEKLEAGANLIQLYTGFVYEGPGLVRRINEAVLRKEV